MKLLEQFGIILTLTFIVETFKELVPLPVPSSVYGLVLMLLLLKFKTFYFQQSYIITDQYCNEQSLID